MINNMMMVLFDGIIYQSNTDIERWRVQVDFRFVQKRVDSAVNLK